MSTTPPPPNDFPPLPAEPPKPRGSRTNTVIIVSAVAVIAAVVATGVIVVNSRDDKTDTSSASTSSTPTDDTITAAAEPEPTPEDTEPEVMGLTDGVSYEDGVEVALSGYKRGTTSEWAAPGNTPYVSFTVKIDNKSAATVDVGTGYFMCFYGEESQEAEQVFDSERGLEGMPSMKLRPGRVAKATVACEMPKGEAYLQVELAPSMDAEVAVFAGNVK